MKFRRGLQVCTVVTAVATLVALTQEPFVEPYVEKTLAEARLALDRALKGRLTPDWVGAELDTAVAREDLDRTELLLALVARNRIPVADSQLARARQYMEREKGILAISVRCASCMVDPAQCRTPSVFLYCNVPIEFTLIGDAKTLVGAGFDAAVGKTVDRIRGEGWSNDASGCTKDGDPGHGRWANSCESCRHSVSVEEY